MWTKKVWLQNNLAWTNLIVTCKKCFLIYYFEPEPDLSFLFFRDWFFETSCVQCIFNPIDWSNNEQHHMNEVRAKKMQWFFFLINNLCVIVEATCVIWKFVFKLLSWQVSCAKFEFEFEFWSRDLICEFCAVATCEFKSLKL